MSNYALQSNANELEYELRRLQGINNELRQELAVIINGVYKANQQLTDYNNLIQGTLENCHGMMNSSHDKVIAAYEMQGEIERLYIRFKNIESANKRIRACNNKKYYEFVNYRTVRKIVQGMMDNLDVKMVSDQTITKSIEVQHLQVPEYWLTCVLISIMAWKNDDKDLACRAMERAVRLDKKNTCIFYMIFNLRMARDEAALKWFSLYQQCDLKGSDQRTFLMLFSLVSKTISEGVDEDTQNEINRYINRVVMDDSKAEGYSEDSITAMICKYFKKLQPNNEVEYPALRRYCPEFAYMAELLLSAKTNINILEFILTTLNVSPEQKNEYLKGYIDELISTPNKVEKEVYEEIKYNELIIDYQGDIDGAKERYEQDKKKAEDDLNLISEMINWIYIKDSKDINGQIRLNMFTLTKELQEKAVNRYVEEYRGKVKSIYQIQINEYSTMADLKDDGKEKQKINDYFTQKKNSLMATVKDWLAYLCFGAGAAAVAGAFFAGYWLFAFALILGGVGAGILFTNKNKKNQLALECQNSIRFTIEILDKILQDYRAYQTEFAEYDGMYERIKNEFSKI